MHAHAKMASVFNHHGNLIMQIKAVILCAAVAAALNIDLSAAERQPGIPSGWTPSAAVGSQFEVGFDQAESATYIRSLGEPGTALGALTQAIDARAYVGKDLVLTMEVKYQAASEGRAEYFLRADGEHQHSGASWDTSSKAWHEVSMQLGSAIGADTPQLDFGVVMQGKGEVWVRKLAFKAIDPAVKKANNVPLHGDLPVATANVQPVNLQMQP